MISLTKPRIGIFWSVQFANILMSRFFQSAVSALVGAMIGFGISQATVGAGVSRNDIRIDNLSALLSDEVQSRRDADNITNVRVDRIADILGKITDQNTQLITLIRTQNKLLLNP
jgi:hypothetical protein